MLSRSPWFSVVNTQWWLFDSDIVKSLRFIWWFLCVLLALCGRMVCKHSPHDFPLWWLSLTSSFVVTRSSRSGPLMWYMILEVVEGDLDPHRSNFRNQSQISTYPTIYTTVWIAETALHIKLRSFCNSAIDTTRWSLWWSAVWMTSLQYALTCYFCTPTKVLSVCQIKILLSTLRNGAIYIYFIYLFIIFFFSVFWKKIKQAILTYTI